MMRIILECKAKTTYTTIYLWMNFEPFGHCGMCCFCFVVQYCGKCCVPLILLHDWLHEVDVTLSGHEEFWRRRLRLSWLGRELRKFVYYLPSSLRLPGYISKFYSTGVQGKNNAYHNLSMNEFWTLLTLWYTLFLPCTPA